VVGQLIIKLINLELHLSLEAGLHNSTVDREPICKNDEQFWAAVSFLVTRILLFLEGGR
jgi:hypothetical protein